MSCTLAISGLNCYARDCFAGSRKGLAWLCSGDEVDVSSIMGKGFPVDRIPPETVSTIYIFATVSVSPCGLAAIWLGLSPILKL